MDNRPIGVFDSGLGGLTAVKELEKILPGETIIYFGDTGRVPYGSKSGEIINKYAMQNIKFLNAHNVKAILAACGTVSSVAKPAGAKAGVPYFDVISSTVEAALKQTKNHRIGVIATATTVNSGAYKNEILTRSPDTTVFEQACPLFVPLVENGFISPQEEVTRLVAERYIAPLREKDIDTLILGCTHYPIISLIISSVIGRHITLVNSGKEAALSLKKQLETGNMLHDTQAKDENRFFVSDDPQGFLNVAEIFLGHKVSGSVEKVAIDLY